MKPGGTIFIRDIDDGLNLAYPDTHEYFAKAMQICSRNEDSGFRESGRQIPSILTKAKFHNVKVEKMCINTAGMNDDEKEAFFDIYFSFILKDAMLMTQHYPNEKSYRDDYNWLKSIYSELEEDFYQEDFFFNLGFMAFSAKR